MASESGQPLRPVALRREGDRLLIEWSDGHRGFTTFRKLRGACPCAGCNEQRQRPPDPFRVLSERELTVGAPAPVAMPARGAYAYQIVWNDGHDTGIYKLEFLRSLCECPECQPKQG
jgi:DUF971 family protein